MNQHVMSRRALLGGVAGVAALTLPGCGSDHDTTDTAGARGPGSAPNASASSPTAVSSSAAGSGAASSGGSGSPGSQPAYVPFSGLEPDLPGNGDGVPDAFFSYPKNPISYAKAPIGTGDSISVLTPLWGGSVSKSKSAWWQNLEHILGVELNLNLVPGADLGAKQQAMIAGGDIPDIAIVNPNNVPLGALEKYFEDLSPHLGGDAVKEYPGLAAIPSIAWKTPTIDGTLYGVPQARIATSFTLAVRQDLLDQDGISTDIANGQDLLDLFKEATDAKHNRWACGQDPLWLLWLTMEMHGMPNYTNAWYEENGKFTYRYELPPMKDCLSIVAGVWKSGYLHPDSAKPNALWFPNGTVCTYVADFVTYSGVLTSNPGIDIGLVPSPKWEGGGLAVKQLDNGAGGNYAAFKKGSPDRIKEVLRLADYIAAPVGTQECLNVNYGKEGVSYTFAGSDPILTDAGKADRGAVGALGYVASTNLDVLYTPGQEDFVKREHKFLTKVMAHTYFNPAVGLYSPTNTSPAGSTAEHNLQNALEDIMFGRKPVSTYDDAIKAWRTTAGDKMRAEYEAAYAKAH